jgi:propanediol dehydratase small subunit
MGFDPRADYPLGSRRPDLVTTPSGLPLAAVTLAAVREGRVDGEEMRATPATLLRQAEVARAAGQGALAANLERAAELATVPDELILAVYTALRPRRATAGELEAWARRLERDHAAPRSAAFVRDAARAYERRGLLAPG